MKSSAARSLALACAVLVAACASEPPVPARTAQEQQCSYEARIGSSIPSTRCTTTAGRQQDRRDAEQITDRARRASKVPRPDSGSN